MKPHVLLIVAVGLLLAADKKPQDAKDSLDGQWSAVEGKGKGTDAPKEYLQKLTITIQGNKFTVKDEMSTHEATFKIDPSKNPKQIDMTPADGPSKGKTVPGIYKLEGKTLTLCLAPEGDKVERPKTFTSDKDKNKNFLLVLKRK